MNRGDCVSHLSDVSLCRVTHCLMDVVVAHGDRAGNGLEEGGIGK